MVQREGGSGIPSSCHSLTWQARELLGEMEFEEPCEGCEEEHGLKTV